jgi:hypothetical protein
MYGAVILPLAKLDVKEAATWYNEQQSGLGKLFTSCVQKKVRYICKNPKSIVIRYGDTRTALLDTFPYLIHFTIDEEAKKVIIIAILSTSRNPKIWEER